MSAWLPYEAVLAASSSRAVASRARLRLRTVLVALLALNAIGLFLLIADPGASESARDAQLAALQARHRALQIQVEQMRDLRAKVMTATQSEHRFAQENFLPRASAFSQMVQYISELAASNRLRSSDVTYRVDEADNQLGWVYLEVSLAVQGDYGDLVRFVNELEQSPQFWLLKGLDVSADRTAGLRLNVLAATYLTPS